MLAEQPLFLRLRAPKAIARTAHGLRLRIAATIPATLSLGRQRFQVDRTARSIRLAVAPGRKPLSLRLVLSAGGKASAVVMRVARS